jgi:hypothetical protein
MRLRIYHAADRFGFPIDQPFIEREIDPTAGVLKIPCGRIGEDLTAISITLTVVDDSGSEVELAIRDLDAWPVKKVVEWSKNGDPAPAVSLALAPKNPARRYVVRFLLDTTARATSAVELHFGGSPLMHGASVFGIENRIRNTDQTGLYVKKLDQIARRNSSTTDRLDALLDIYRQQAPGPAGLKQWENHVFEVLEPRIAKLLRARFRNESGDRPGNRDDMGQKVLMKVMKQLRRGTYETAGHLLNASALAIINAFHDYLDQGQALRNRRHDPDADINLEHDKRRPIEPWVRTEILRAAQEALDAGVAKMRTAGRTRPIKILQIHGNPVTAKQPNHVKAQLAGLCKLPARVRKDERKRAGGKYSTVLHESLLEVAGCALSSPAVRDRVVLALVVLEINSRGSLTEPLIRYLSGVGTRGLAAEFAGYVKSYLKSGELCVPDGGE